MLSGRRRVACLAAVVALSSVAVPDTWAATSGTPDDGCADQRFIGVIVGCQEKISFPGAGAVDPPGGSGGTAESAPVCQFGDLVIPCAGGAGSWSNGCYIAAADPQPPFDDPVWAGRIDGVVVTCTPYPCITLTGTTIPDCPSITRYWAPAAPVVVIDEGDIARRALAELGLEPVTISMAPAPDLADPNVLIDAPAYFWAEGGELAIGPTGTTVTEQGITITLDATLDSVTYDTGDGTTLTCTREQVATAPSSMSLQGEPDCGHRWASPGTYALTATSAWTIAWQGPTQNGTFDYALDSTIDVAVTDRPVNLTTEKTS